METLKLGPLDQAIQQLIRQAGIFAKREFEQFSFSEVKYKAENDPFTYVDVKTEEMLVEGCKPLIPNAGFINEETGVHVSESDYVWIIDPIDGTSNFTHGIPHFSISLALQYQGNTLLGYVYEPVNGNMFRARKGGGAFLNDKPISVSENSHLNVSLVGLGFPYGNGSWQKDYLRLVESVMKHAQGVRRMGSAALDLAYVACGRFGAFFEFDLKPYDVAAGILIVQEAGGNVSDFKGGDNYIFGRQVLATNGKVHDHLLGVIQEYSDLINI
ncbi:UNVERIFIED_CONTAM: hypothetical protein GTU68_024494 [Idotea baltica]|nr:hypothetical protein [Idotea baltica]